VRRRIEMLRYNKVVLALLWLFDNARQWWSYNQAEPAT